MSGLTFPYEGPSGLFAFVAPFCGTYRLGAGESDWSKVRIGTSPTLTTRTTFTNGIQKLQNFVAEIIDIAISTSLTITAKKTKNK